MYANAIIALQAKSRYRLSLSGQLDIYFFGSILGMYLFGGKFCKYTDEYDNTRECKCREIVEAHPRCECDRKHFNNFLWATVTVFQVRTPGAGGGGDRQRIPALFTSPQYTVRRNWKLQKKLHYPFFTIGISKTIINTLYILADLFSHVFIFSKSFICDLILAKIWKSLFS